MTWMGGAVLCGVLGLTGLTAPAQSNLCYNGAFNASQGPLDGWNVNYEWTGNSKYAGNHYNASFLPEFKGRKNVLKMVVPKDVEAKVETPLMEYETGARYKCTFDLYTEVDLRVLFLGYNWRPGIAPGEAPKLQDMRRIYKGDALSVVGGAGWKTMTVTFPHEQISELAYSHLKKVRYVTVMLFVPGATGYVGNYYMANVKVVKLPVKCKVTKGAVKSGADDGQ
jgi:hypothetical protein